MSLLLSPFPGSRPIETLPTLPLVDGETKEGRALARAIQQLQRERKAPVFDGEDPGQTEPELPAVQPTKTKTTRKSGMLLSQSLKRQHIIPVPLKVLSDDLPGEVTPDFLDCVWQALDRVYRMHNGWIPQTLYLPGNVYWPLMFEGITEVTYHGEKVLLCGGLKLAPNLAHCSGE